MEHDRLLDTAPTSRLLDLGFYYGIHLERSCRKMTFDDPDMLKLKRIFLCKIESR